jgi:hypothetical protein
MGILLKATKSTPYIKFEKGVLQIQGKSMPEDVVKVYGPVIQAVRDYVDNPEQITEAEFFFEYLNSSSNRVVLTILTLFEQLIQKGFEVKVTWKFEKGDELISDLGHDLEAVVKVPIHIIEMN